MLTSRSGIKSPTNRFLMYNNKIEIRPFPSRNVAGNTRMTKAFEERRWKYKNGESIRNPGLPVTGRRKLRKYKLLIITEIILPAMLYGCKIWATVTKKFIEKLSYFQYPFIKSAFDVPWQRLYSSENTGSTNGRREDVVYSEQLPREDR